MEKSRTKYFLQQLIYSLRRIVYFMLVLAGIFLFWFAVHTAYVVYVGTRTPQHHADVAVIFGTAVMPNGKMTNGLKLRVDAGLEIFEQGLVDKIVVTGGKSWSGHDEGSVMRDYLVSQGVPKDKIIVDNEGDDSWKSAVNLKRLQQEHGFQSVIAVSHYYHLARIKITLKRTGFTDVQTYSPAVYLDKKSLLREFVAFYAYLLMY